MTNHIYRPLGDFIRIVDNRNKDLSVTKLFGLTIEKKFIPSVANVIGTDLSNYKVIRKNQFACSLMQVSRDGKMPIAMFPDDIAIMSPAYPMFEIIDENQILPKYLFMWFSRSEFDRQASYLAVGGVRGSLMWEDFCSMSLPVPSIDEQRKIVSEYETVQRRIDNNRQLINKLEETAQTLYKKMFVDGIDKENLPEGWRMGRLGEVCEITDGTHDSPKPTKEGYPLITSVHLEQWSINKENAYLISKQDYTKINERSIVEIGDILYSMIGTIGNISLVSEKVDFAVKNMAIIKSSKNKEFIEYIFIFFKSKEMKDIISSNLCGSTQNYITLSILRDIRIKIPTQEMIRNFHKKAYKIIKLIILYNNEIKKLTELQSLLLAKMGR